MPFLYKHELDAFLVQAVDPHMMDTEHIQKLEVFKLAIKFGFEFSISFFLLLKNISGATNYSTWGYVSSYVHARC